MPPAELPFLACPQHKKLVEGNLYEEVSTASYSENDISNSIKNGILYLEDPINHVCVRPRLHKCRHGVLEGDPFRGGVLMLPLSCALPSMSPFSPCGRQEAELRELRAGARQPLRCSCMTLATRWLLLQQAQRFPHLKEHSAS